MNLPLYTLHSPLVRRSRRSGFTLIEILVATTILLVIVILASLVFQQTTGAYQTGERKVNAQVALRNVIGTMTRDLALAVDSRDYDGLDNEFPSKGGTASGISFVALTGTPGIDAKGGEYGGARTARFISYSSGTRTEETVKYSNGKWRTSGASAEAKLYDKTSYEDTGDLEISFSCDWPQGDSDAELPECVHIRVELEGGGLTTAVGVGSGGRRGWDSPDEENDEIWVGVKPD